MLVFDGLLLWIRLLVRPAITSVRVAGLTKSEFNNVQEQETTCKAKACEAQSQKMHHRPPGARNKQHTTDSQKDSVDSTPSNSKGGQSQTIQLHEGGQCQIYTLDSHRTKPTTHRWHPEDETTNTSMTFWKTKPTMHRSNAERQSQKHIDKMQEDKVKNTSMTFWKTKPTTHR